jgi:predicted nuclease with TOPRIM domain
MNITEPEPTCPIIDEIKNILESIKRKLDNSLEEISDFVYAGDRNPDDLDGVRTDLQLAQDEYEGLNEMLEEVRESNRILRILSKK